MSHPEITWRCFHCEEVFFDFAAAAEHFGPTQLSDPACRVDAAQLRTLEAELRAYRDEDTELHRRIQTLRSDMAAAVRKAEEDGYARGLADAGFLLPPAVLRMCEHRDWSLHWTCRGAYLHLEASELIEAVRGKGTSSPTEEAGDVLIVLMSITESQGIPWERVLACAQEKVGALMTKPRYDGEYASPAEQEVCGG